ncbi:hypothetical protein GGS21DRAFT_514785 [Xylaria nigripes]|nr:hypothetical protein GGS21DRAFT_514785 [Xylaria nigripes]
MKVVISSLALATLLGLANAIVHLTNSNFDGIVAGSTFDITWADAQGPVTLTLKNGDSTDLQTVSVITSDASGFEFPWSVDPNLPSGDYALEIEDGSDQNFSTMFHISGTGTTADSAAVASTTASTSASASSSASSSSETSAVSSSASTASGSSSLSMSVASIMSTSTTSASSSSISAGPTSSNSSTTAKPSSTAAISTLPNSSSSTSAPSSASPSQTQVPDTNGANSMAASFVPGFLAVIGAALL